MAGPTAAAGPASSPAGTEALFGVFRVGAAQVALPLSELREVIPCPAEFSQLPAKAAGLLGAVNLRHLVVPVVDLDQLAGAEDHGRGEVIVIVAREGEVLGLIANEIIGVSRVPAGGLMDMVIAGDGLRLFSRSFEQPHDGSVVSVLDSAAISGMPGVPVVKDRGPRDHGVLSAAASPQSATTQSTTTKSTATKSATAQSATAQVAAAAGFVRASDANRVVMLLRCGQIGLSVDVAHVHSVIPNLVIHSSPLAGRSCRGAVHFAEQSVPVVDLLALMGLGTLPVENAQRGVVLEMPAGLVVLCVSDVTNIESVPADDVLPLPAIGKTKSGFLLGALAVPGVGQHLMLDGAALRADPELDGLARLGLPLVPDGNGGGQAPDAGYARSGDLGEGRRVVPSVRKFLTYHAGIEVATPLTQISEILPYPADYIPLDRGDGVVEGVFTHRRATVPLLCLPTLLGRSIEMDRTTARVLLVDAAGGYVGFIVPSLNAIEESIWEEAMRQGEEHDKATATKRLVKVGTQEGGRMLPHVDLARLATAM